MASPQTWWTVKDSRGELYLAYASQHREEAEIRAKELNQRSAVHRPFEIAEIQVRELER